METKKSEGRTAYQNTSLLWHCGLELTVVLIKKNTIFTLIFQVKEIDTQINKMNTKKSEGRVAYQSSLL